MFQIGSIIDNSYRLNRELGRGGFGVVYAADELGNAEILGPRDTGESQSVLRTVALKLLSLDPSQWRRFRTEVHALCRLNHPNIVQVYTYGRAGVPYIVMELVEGRGWNEILKEPGRTIHPQQTLRTLIQVAMRSSMRTSGRSFTVTSSPTTSSSRPTASPRLSTSVSPS